MTAQLEPVALYERASAGFADRVKLIGDRWTAPTPLPGWDVRALVDHIRDEQRWVATMLRGVPLPDLGTADHEADALAEIRADGALERAVDLPFGEPTGREYVMQVAADHLVHTWDLARALGTDETLDPDAVDTVIAWFVAREDAYRAKGAVGPRVATPADASAQVRLLAMFGRKA